MFTRSCGGRTRSPEEVACPSGLPYFAVICNYGQQNPWRWTAALTQSEATDLEKRERLRAWISIGGVAGMLSEQ